MGLEKNSKIKLHQKFPKGPRNLITDVAGVTVGQVTLNDNEKEIHTGVTAIRGHEGNLFQETGSRSGCDQRFWEKCRTCAD